MTPAVTLGSELASTKPNGLPMAMAHSPITSASESPSGATGSPRASIFRTARSFASSVPSLAAVYVVPSRIITEIRVAF